MLNKRNKKRGFTLIELIIVIAIIAILAAIAVPAFGKIRQKANVSSDIANARTIYSLVATELASDNIDYGDGTTTKNDPLYSIGKGDPATITNGVLGNIPAGNVNVQALIEPKPVVKTYQNAEYVVTIKADGSIQVNIKSGNSYENVYPKTSGKYSDTGAVYSEN